MKTKALKQNVLDVIKSRVYLLLMVIVPVILIVSGCDSTENKGNNVSTPTPSQQQIRMAYQPIVFGLPVFVGLEQKIFQKHDLSVEAKSFTSANDMLNALVAGQVEVIPGSPLVPVLSLESKYPGRFRVISHSVMTSNKPFDKILVKSGSSIKTPKDLGNKKLGLIPGTTASNVVRAFLKKQGIDPQTVSFIQLAPTAQLPALESGSIDALYAYEPLVTIALNQGNSYREITGSIYTSLLDPCPLVVAIVDRNFERQNPEAVKKVIESLDEVFQVMKEKPDVATAALVPYLKISPDIALKVNIQNMTNSKEMQLSNLQGFIDILRNIGEIEQPIEAKQLMAEIK